MTNSLFIVKVYVLYRALVQKSVTDMNGPSDTEPFLLQQWAVKERGLRGPWMSTSHPIAVLRRRAILRQLWTVERAAPFQRSFPHLLRFEWEAGPAANKTRRLMWSCWSYRTQKTVVVFSFCAARLQDSSSSLQLRLLLSPFRFNGQNSGADWLFFLPLLVYSSLFLFRSIPKGNKWRGRAAVSRHKRFVVAATYRA